MLFILGIVAAFLPPGIALTVHLILRRREVSGRRRAFYFLFYFLLIHVIVFIVAAHRGVHGLTLYNMTMRYELKHLAAGLVCAVLLPFPGCLLLEPGITVKGFLKYGRRTFSDIRRYSQYVVRSARANLRAEVANSYLDWLWWVLEPFAMMLIYTFIFGVAFGSKEPYFPIFVFIGLTMYTFFSKNVSYGVVAIRVNKAVVTKVYLPKYMLLVSHMLMNAFKMMICLGIAFCMMLIFKVPLTAYILCAVPVLLEYFLLTFGVGLIFVHFGVYVSDLSYIVGILLNMLMYLSGIFYSMDRFPEPFDFLLGKLNPVAFLINSMRDAMLYGVMPDWGTYAGWMCASLVLVCVGLYTVYKNENAYVKVI